MGIQNNPKICVEAPAYSGHIHLQINKEYNQTCFVKTLFSVLYHFNVFWKFLRLRNSARDFLGVNFRPRDFWGFITSPIKSFLGVFYLFNKTTFP